jgi:hypothetical protein
VDFEENDDGSANWAGVSGLTPGTIRLLGMRPNPCYAFSVDTSFDRLARLLAKDIDETLLRRHLALTPTQRLAKLMELQRFAEQARRARAHDSNGSSEKAR